MRDKVKYALAGIFAGAANGFFGAGGGMILIPVFRRFFKTEEKKAFATSLAVILPMSIVSAVVYFLKGNVDFGSAVPFITGGTIGGFVGGRVFGKVSGKLLGIIFSLFMIYGGVRLIMR